MKFTVQEVVHGATLFAGNIDGKDVESSTVFTTVSLESDGKGWGSRTEPRRCENKDVIERIRACPFPFTADVSYEEKATKGKSQLIVIDVKPHLNQPKPREISK